MATATAPRMAFEDRGTGSPLVFIHGLTFSRRTWDPILDLLSSQHRCIAIDLPGHGESAGLPRSLQGLLYDIHALINDLGIERPVIVGHSFGGIFATIYAATFPVGGVVNVDQPLDTRAFIGMLQQMEPGLRGLDFAAVFEPIRQSIGVELLPEPIRSATLATQTIRQDVVLAYWDELLTQSSDHVLAFVDMATAQITTRYLAIFGRQLSDAERVDLESRLPQIEIEEWAGCGHMVHLMDPERFAGRVAAFASSSGM
jgi:pimeloyl-ACP methyl ester carboxylesterase